MSVFNRLGDRAIGFIGALVLALVTGLGVFVYTSYTAGQIQHQKTEVMFQMLLQSTKHGSAITVDNGDGTKRPATRLDVLVLMAEQAADNIKQNQDKAAVQAQPPVGPDGGK